MALAGSLMQAGLGFGKTAVSFFVLTALLMVITASLSWLTRRFHAFTNTEAKSETVTGKLDPRNLPTGQTVRNKHLKGQLNHSPDQRTVATSPCKSF